MSWLYYLYKDNIMARKPRFFCDSNIYHVILRGNNQQNLFNDDNDRLFFLRRLEKYSKELDIEIYAYCLMNNHVHLLIGKANRSMSLLIQKLANSYVYYFNRKYERCGHLFQGRFKSEPIQNDEYFKTVLRYILQNSEKAGLESVSKYRWNSYFAFMNEISDFVNTKYCLDLFDSKQQLMNYLNQKSEDQCMEFENKKFYSDEKALKLIKKMFNIDSPYFLERFHVDIQMQNCKILKEKGLSINQISRITGISKSIIKTA